ncbi:MAG: hypothetical protein GY757_03025, partial [bacterium]|nr:hypothetical protein [bacterium]
KDDKNELILYNYHSHLYTTLSQGTERYHYNSREGMIYILPESKSKSTVNVITLSPYSNKRINIKQKINSIVASFPLETYLSTRDGEILKMDYQYNLSYAKPSLEGCLYKDSPSKQYTAAYINERLIIMNFQEEPAPQDNEEKKEDQK